MLSGNSQGSLSIATTPRSLTSQRSVVPSTRVPSPPSSLRFPSKYNGQHLTSNGHIQSQTPLATERMNQYREGVAIHGVPNHISSVFDSRESGTSRSPYFSEIIKEQEALNAYLAGKANSTAASSGKQINHPTPAYSQVQPGVMQSKEQHTQLPPHARGRSYQNVLTSAPLQYVPQLPSSSTTLPPIGGPLASVFDPTSNPQQYNAVRAQLLALKPQTGVAFTQNNGVSNPFNKTVTLSSPPQPLGVTESVDTLPHTGENESGNIADYNDDSSAYSDDESPSSSLRSPPVGAFYGHKSNDLLTDSNSNFWTSRSNSPSQISSRYSKSPIAGAAESAEIAVMAAVYNMDNRRNDPSISSGSPSGTGMRGNSLSPVHMFPNRSNEIRSAISEAVMSLSDLTNMKSLSDHSRARSQSSSIPSHTSKTSPDGYSNRGFSSSRSLSVSFSPSEPNMKSLFIDREMETNSKSLFGPLVDHVSPSQEIPPSQPLPSSIGLGLFGAPERTTISINHLAPIKKVESEQVIPDIPVDISKNLAPILPLPREFLHSPADSRIGSTSRSISGGSEVKRVTYSVEKKTYTFISPTSSNHSSPSTVADSHAVDESSTEVKESRSTAEQELLPFSGDEESDKLKEEMGRLTPPHASALNENANLTSLSMISPSDTPGPFLNTSLYKDDFLYTTGVAVSDSVPYIEAIGKGEDKRSTPSRIMPRSKLTFDSLKRLSDTQSIGGGVHNSTIESFSQLSLAGSSVGLNRTSTPPPPPPLSTSFVSSHPFNSNLNWNSSITPYSASNFRRKEGSRNAASSSPSVLDTSLPAINGQNNNNNINPNSFSSRHASTFSHQSAPHSSSVASGAAVRSEASVSRDKVKPKRSLLSNSNLSTGNVNFLLSKPLYASTDVISSSHSSSSHGGNMNSSSSHLLSQSHSVPSFSTLPSKIVPSSTAVATTENHHASTSFPRGDASPPPPPPPSSTNSSFADVSITESPLLHSQYKSQYTQRRTSSAGTSIPRSASNNNSASSEIVERMLRDAEVAEKSGLKSLGLSLRRQVDVILGGSS